MVTWMTIIYFGSNTGNITFSLPVILCRKFRLLLSVPLMNSWIGNRCRSGVRLWPQLSLLYQSLLRALVEWWQEGNQNTKRKLFQCHFSHHKSHVDNSGVEPGPPHLQSQWLSTWAMAQHCKLIWLSHCFSIYILDMPCWQMKRNLKKKKKRRTEWQTSIKILTSFAIISTI